MNGSKQMQGTQKLRGASVIEEQCNGKRLIVTSINNEVTGRKALCAPSRALCEAQLSSFPPVHCGLH